MQLLHDVKQKTASFQQLTCPDTTTVQTSTVPGDARAMWITVETTDARLSFHGTTPSATVGHIAKIATNGVYHPFAVPVKAVSTAGTSALVNITYLY